MLSFIFAALSSMIPLSYYLGKSSGRIEGLKLAINLIKREQGLIPGWCIRCKVRKYYQDGLCEHCYNTLK